MRDQRESEFMEMLARCERTLFKVCLFYTDRQPDNVRDMYQDIVCDLKQAWPNFRHESKENTWVYRVALNTAVAQLLKRKKLIFLNLFFQGEPTGITNLGGNGQNSQNL